MYTGVAGWQWPSWEVAKQGTPVPTHLRVGHRRHPRAPPGLMWGLPRSKPVQPSTVHYSVTGQLQHYASPYLYFPAPFTAPSNATVGDIIQAASLASHTPVSLQDLRCVIFTTCVF